MQSYRHEETNEMGIPRITEVLAWIPFCRDQLLIHEGRELVSRDPVSRNHSKSWRGDHLQIGTFTSHKCFGDMIKNKSSGNLSSLEERKKNLVDAKELQHVRLMVEKPVYVGTLCGVSLIFLLTIICIGVSQIFSTGCTSICIYLCRVD
jgi:hypothetical protein